MYCFALKRGHSMIIKELSFTSSKIQQPIHFVHISDVHMGSRNEKHAEKIVEMILPLKPDFVVITGDLLDSPMVNPSEFDAFKKLTKQIPVYLSFGNHDYLTGEKKVRELCEYAGIQIIENEILTQKNLNCSLIGINDSGKTQYIKQMKITTEQLTNDTYNIMLHHRPQSEQETCQTGKYDLMLAGHTHSGQIAPVGLLVHVAFEKPRGLHRIYQNENEMFLYTNPGTGAWGAHMRSLDENEITFIHIEPKREE